VTCRRASPAVQTEPFHQAGCRVRGGWAHLVAVVELLAVDFSDAVGQAVGADHSALQHDACQVSETASGRIENAAASHVGPTPGLAVMDVHDGLDDAFGRVGHRDALVILHV